MFTHMGSGSAQHAWHIQWLCQAAAQPTARFTIQLACDDALARIQYNWREHTTTTGCCGRYEPSACMHEQCVPADRSADSTLPHTSRQQMQPKCSPTQTCQQRQQRGCGCTSPSSPDSITAPSYKPPLCACCLQPRCCGSTRLS